MVRLVFEPKGRIFISKNDEPGVKSSMISLPHLPATVELHTGISLRSWQLAHKTSEIPLGKVSSAADQALNLWLYYALTQMLYRSIYLLT